MNEMGGGGGDDLMSGVGGRVRWRGMGSGGLEEGWRWWGQWMEGGCSSRTPYPEGQPWHIYGDVLCHAHFRPCSYRQRQLKQRCRSVHATV